MRAHVFRGSGSLLGVIMDPFVQLDPAACAESCAQGVILIINGLEYTWYMYMVKLASMFTSPSDRRPADVLVFHTTVSLCSCSC